MKLTSRMKFALMQRFIINMIFFIILASVVFFYLYVEIQQYEVMKAELSEDYNYYAEIQKNGIDLQRLLASLRKSGQLQDSYLRNVFSQVTPQFYQKHFTNDTDQSFDAFLDTKNGEIDRIKSTPEYQERYRILDDILPVFSPGIKITENDMTNAQFINNVENLLYSFNLTHRGEIGIQSLSLVESEVDTTTTQEGQDNNLAENIFMIPLELTVEGMKGNIVNFLHYLSYVGGVEADLQNNTLIPYNDSFLGSSAERDSRYLGQLVTIERVHFEEYLDSSATQSSEEFIARVRSAAQFRERYQVRMTVNFYVAGYPQYRINEAIDELKESLQNSITEMDEGLKAAAEAFDQSESQKVATHRVLARTVTRLRENFSPLQSTNIVELGQNEVIELYNELLQLKTLEDMTRENYNTFMR